MAQAISTGTFCEAKWLVDPTAGQGTHTTIATALTSASSGDTIFIRPGTYTENLTLKAGVNLSAFVCDGSLNATGHVIISGTCTLTTAGSVTISGIQLQTNSAALLAVTGSAASVVNLNNCYLNCTNTTGITYSSSDATSAININNCSGNIGTTGISLYTMSSSGTLSINYTVISNTGGATTTSSNSAGVVSLMYSEFSFPFATSSTGILSGTYAFIFTSATNTTCVTTAGTGQGNFISSFLNSGSASALSIGTGTTSSVHDLTVSSTNTNAITGAGTLLYSSIAFPDTSSGINTTTVTRRTLAGGAYLGRATSTTPPAGMVGEQLRANATTVSITSAAYKTIASVTLTPGIWDVSAVGDIVFAGAGSVIQINISTTTNALTGTEGDAYTQMGLSVGSFSSASASIPSYRVELAASTTYYCVMLGVFTSTATANARISATRVA